MEMGIKCWYRQFVNGDGQIIESFGRILAVKVAGRDDLAAFGQDDGIVRGAVHLGRDDALNELDRVVHDTVHLRTAAQRVSVLDPIAEAVALGNGRRIGLNNQLFSFIIIFFSIISYFNSN